MARFFLDKDGTYFETVKDVDAKSIPDAVPVLQRPDRFSVWNSTSSSWEKGEPVISPDEVNAELYRRLNMPHMINIPGLKTSVPAQIDKQSQDSINSWKAIAQQMISYGKGSEKTTFRDAKNVNHTVAWQDAPGIAFEISKAALSLKSKAWDLKDKRPIPVDYNDDKYWT